MSVSSASEDAQPGQASQTNGAEGSDALLSGRFVWSELLTTDEPAARQFYETVIGWSSRDAGMAEPYRLLLAAGVPVAGVMPLPAELRARGVPPHWTPYIGTADIVRLTEALKEKGGTVLWGPQMIEGVGTLAAVSDPQGASFSLLQPAAGAAAPQAEPGTPGTAGWHELHAVDGASAFAFYQALFGWVPNQVHDMGAAGTYQTFDTGNVWAGGVMTKMPHTPHPHWMTYFTVENAGAAAERIRQAGGTVILGPQPVPGGSFVVQAKDPQGAVFAVVSRRAE